MIIAELAELGFSHWRARAKHTLSHFGLGKRRPLWVAFQESYVLKNTTVVIAPQAQSLKEGFTQEGCKTRGHHRRISVNLLCLSYGMI